MIRFAVAGLALLALAGTAVAEEDNSAMLVDLFAKICAPKPARPSQIQRIATSLGFVSDNPVTPEKERGANIDVIYFARLMKNGEKVGGISTYFTGPDDGPTVSCSVSATGVSADTLPSLIETSLKARERADQPTEKENYHRASWRVGADTIEMSAWQTPPRRASISMSYIGYKR
ncbi:hypothetical protein [Bradyrhizobium liaoningense]|uniref:hypothetical protein n=1 Tax=Bradyrhizobium liaoningense TaxID=43992 RepID=UPI001BA49DBF|nr:hypothetical protein [Bradyrhizobium liaoningense]MBR0718563.1 hypothetical protein [Bradyrhizobium liaoningense]